MNQLVRTVSSTDLIDSFVRALNGVLNLTEREIALLVELIKIDMTADPNDSTFTVIDQTTRKVLSQRLNMSINVLSTNLKRLIVKHCLSINGNRWRVHKALIPDIIAGSVVQIRIVLKLGTEESVKPVA
jgi:hypothetical protein